MESCCLLTKRKKAFEVRTEDMLVSGMLLVSRYYYYLTLSVTSSISVPLHPCRLNGLKWVKNDSLEVVSQVTLMDFRDNCLDSLDLSSVSSLETLHCQRNQLGALTLSGFTLRTLNASSNRESSTALTTCRCDG